MWYRCQRHRNANKQKGHRNKPTQIQKLDSQQRRHYKHHLKKIQMEPLKMKTVIIQITIQKLNSRLHNDKDKEIISKIEVGLKKLHRTQRGEGGHERLREMITVRKSKKLKSFREQRMRVNIQTECQDTDSQI